MRSILRFVSGSQNHEHGKISSEIFAVPKVHQNLMGKRFAEPSRNSKNRSAVLLLLDL